MNKNEWVKRIIMSLIIIVLIVCIVFYVSTLLFKGNKFDKARLVVSYDVDATIDEMDTVVFGSYPQTDITGSKKEPIEWLVLDRKDSKTLLFSKYVLDYKQYNETWDNITWEACSLRKCLNDEFYYNAFDDNEKNRIIITNVINKAPVLHRTSGGNDTRDKVFCLSEEEISRYFVNGSWSYRFRKKTATRGTEYAKLKGNFEVDTFNMWYSNNSEYWLRTPDFQNQDSVECVERIGFVGVP